MTPEELARAVERLRVHSHSATIGFRPLAKPLAALIEAAAEIDDNFHLGWCPARYERPQGCTCGVGALDCALVAIVRAINGDEEERS